ncbi:NAD(P)/FAD-dependent oxidoreductase [Nocardia miyunensis]|uniref:NAD(P)/FAD-dependent oxidoreductase n=1 Tax=Nocardia miyunensis TaxID=282684 RepID=UPI0008320C71|nr:FAD-dependent oxidoreductase [Nocardia miyunensis]
MHESASVAIIGAGHAGIELASALRMNGFGDSLVVIGDETHLPYARPILSKGYLRDGIAPERIALRPANFYEKFDVRIRTGTPATRIDRAHKEIGLANGDLISYGTLVIATGGRARTLPAPALRGAANVHHLRTVDDASALREQLTPGARLVVLGGGYIGLEVAATARGLGLEVTVIEAAGRVLGRVAGTALSRHLQDLHEAESVRVRVDTRVRDLRREGDRITAVELEDGTVLDADLVVIGVGIEPNDTLAAECGLAVSDGVLVDEFCRTADPAIFAIGDCSRHPDQQWGGSRRLESVPNAAEQARTVSSVILGEGKAYTSIPWFWSDQFGTTVRTVGLSGASDTVVHRHVDGKLHAVFFLHDGELRAAEMVNDTKGFAIARKLVAQRARIETALLADPDVPLASILESLEPDHV